MSGYVSLTSSNILGDAALVSILQQMVSALTGLSPYLVRPLWQPQPPTQPSVMTDWCALGITKYTSYDYPQFTQDTDTSGTVHRYERIDVHTMFYGPDASALAVQLRDGIYLQQNYQTLAASGLKLRGADEIVHLGEEINSQFVHRSDLAMSFYRMADASYSGSNISTIGTINIGFATDDGLSCIETVVNPE